MADCFDGQLLTLFGRHRENPINYYAKIRVVGDGHKFEKMLPAATSEDPVVLRFFRLPDSWYSSHRDSIFKTLLSRSWPIISWTVGGPSLFASDTSAKYCMEQYQLVGYSIITNVRSSDLDSHLVASPTMYLIHRTRTAFYTFHRRIGGRKSVRVEFQNQVESIFVVHKSQFYVKVTMS